ncbi:hypothetical protein V8E55_003682 [Tylopilus felleus]
MAIPRVWLVTGASSGFGRSLTEFVLTKGDVVVATLRKPEVLQDLSARYPEDRLLVLKLDVANQTEIDHAFARTKEVFGRLDVVFNNAGYVVFGDAETTPADAARALFEVNFWGAVNVSRAAVKFFREVNEPGRGGLLIQTSSVAGLEAIPRLSFYTLDGFSEALAMEVLPEWNIKICILQPGGFKTNVFANAIYLPENPVYKDRMSVPLGSGSGHKVKRLGDPAKLAKAIYSLVEGGHVLLHLPVGQDTLEVAQRKVESLTKEISEGTVWSVDLSCD